MSNERNERERNHFASLLQLETALLRWFDMESRGETEGSLNGILAELQYPV